MQMSRACRRTSILAAGFLALLAGGLVTPDPIAAQYSESSYFETWTDIATIYNFSDQFRYDGDYGIRAALSTADFTQLYVRPSVRYEVLPWLRLHGGLGWFHTFFRDATDANEIRPWLGVRFVGPRPGGFLIQNYFRLEFRAFEFGRGGDSETAWRGRWQLQVRSPDFRIGPADRFYALAFAETFHTFNAEIEGFAAERLRLNLGAGKTLSPHWRVELNGMYQHGRVETGVSGFDLDEGILRLRMFYSFN
jgi:hypothetical protein